MTGSAHANQGHSVFEERTLDQLILEDEASFAHVALYDDLKQVLRRARQTFRILPKGKTARWDRALFLNLTYWGADAGGDVLVDEHLEADVVAHVAWHHLAKSQLRASTPAALFLGEAIASAFDLYLVGRLLGHAPHSSFLESQVPAMAEAAEAAGLSEKSFATLLREVASDPERAFEDLRALLFDASTALFACEDARVALVSLSQLEGRRFASLLHRYELSNWVLYARCHGDRTTEDVRTCQVDRALREAEASIDWLAEHWVKQALVAT